MTKNCCYKKFPNYILLMIVVSKESCQRSDIFEKIRFKDGLIMGALILTSRASTFLDVLLRRVIFTLFREFR
jgi:hypothetical protein